MEGDMHNTVDKWQVLFMQSMKQQLDTNESEDDAQTVGQVDEAVQQAVEQEVHLTQTHERKRVGGKYQECFRGNTRSEEHTSELQSRFDLVCRLLLEKKK